MLESINVRNLSKSYAGRKVLDNLNFVVQSGRVHGFLGPNGAGKSTTMRILAGILSFEEGQVEIEGKSIRENLNWCKKNIGILPENPPLYFDMIVKDYLMFVADLYSVENPSAHIDKLIEKLGLQEVQHRLIGNLSKGFKQKVGVAQALVGDPKILLLDEPTIGLDPHAVVEMRKLILDLANHHTVLVSSHLLHEISLTCQDITIINHGKIITSGPLSEIESTFSSKQIIHVDIATMTEDQFLKLQNLAIVEKVTRLNRAEQITLTIYLNTTKDCRRELSEFFVANQMGLLGFQQGKMMLEDIFLSVTAKADKQ